MSIGIICNTTENSWWYQNHHIQPQKAAKNACLCLYKSIYGIDNNLREQEELLHDLEAALHGADVGFTIIEIIDNPR